MADLRLLNPASDREVVAKLLIRATDYVVLETGLPPDAASVAAFFTDLPPGGRDGDQFRFAILDRAGRVQGLAELARDYPQTGIWYLGLLLLAPPARGRGLGQDALTRLMDWARARGAVDLRLAVLWDNARGRAFWARNGFAPLRVAPPAQIGQRRHVRLVMQRKL